jgi:hypothetical protein
VAQGDPAAVRHADQVGVLDAQRGQDVVEQHGQVVGCGDRPGLARGAGLADRVEGDHRVVAA